MFQATISTFSGNKRRLIASDDPVKEAIASPDPISENAGFQ
jgi:hypothetical protein